MFLGVSRLVDFKKVVLDEIALTKKASECFFECAKNLQESDLDDFESFFDGYSLTDMKTQLFKLHYTKYFDNEFLGFDGSTEFHYEIHIHIYALDNKGDTDQLAVYRLIMNEDLEVVDDILI